MTASRISLSRAQILGFRRTVQALDRRLPPGPDSLRRAAWAGLQDSMPRAALLSIHARVEDTTPAALEDSSLVQLWGPRYSVYVVAAADRALFTIGRLAGDPKAAKRTEAWVARLAPALEDGPLTDRQAGRAIGEDGPWMKYAAPSGRILIRWEGSRAPTIWMVPAPEVDPGDAQRELARRYLHVFGPGTPEAFATWAGISPGPAATTLDALRDELTAVRTPIGDAWILASDEAVIRAPARPAAPARLLPSGDTYYLLQGADRELLLPDVAQRTALWTSRVWPGALLVGGEIVGTWRRAGHRITATVWRRLAGGERTAVESEAASLPLPGVAGRIVVTWEG